MATIPADPGMVIGNIVNPERIKNLMAIAEKQQPKIVAQDTLNNLIQSNYKLRMIYTTMVQQKVDVKVLRDLQEEMDTLKDAMALAAVELVKATITAENEIATLKDQQEQTTITMNIESPIDYASSSLQQFELAFDSLKFDVRYFRREEVGDTVEALNETVNSYVAQTKERYGYGYESGGASNTTIAGTSQTQRHDIEGTIVITANCTHKMADVLAPFVLDPRKAVDAWNYTFEDDILNTTATECFEAAMNEAAPTEETNKLSLLSGVTKGSSFVGYVHVLKAESSKSGQEAESTASAVRESIGKMNFLGGMIGGGGTSKSAAENATSLMSKSEISNQVNLVVQGCIPSIVANDIPSTVKRLKPTPEAIMGNLMAIQSTATDAVNSSPANLARNARTGNQMQQLSNQHLNTSVEKLEEENTESNKVINCASMMTAFTDYIQKCKEGKCGIPINFFLKELTKADIAKCYIRNFYPNGASSAEDYIKGAIGKKES